MSIVVERGGVKFNAHEAELMHRETGERRTFLIIGDPVDPSDMGLAKVRRENIREHDDNAPKLIPYIPETPDFRNWTLPPEVVEEAYAEAAEASARDKAESLEHERAQLTQVWGAIAEQTGRSMHDFFPEVFPE